MARENWAAQVSPCDPTFRPKKRLCGRCGKQTTTKPERRYFCKKCFRFSRTLVGEREELIFH